MDTLRADPLEPSCVWAEKVSMEQFYADKHLICIILSENARKRFYFVYFDRTLKIISNGKGASIKCIEMERNE